ncbi:phosphoenolpyruvate synthase [Marinimicrobium sp. ABcell2]|uniref:phosphoenolpyruvate synthase n=1 Tax=Marinimicrobium sp. ABcell2 TaxID=3069751 RepID=UPI0027B78BAF|nr:phosphoenolpyruvate synthase [Marinimicrobium sp. ABcell2]MDQ2075298.1 phosphoenolpyruvate synthase [Marinimicrobium sp. ABcell2]
MSHVDNILWFEDLDMNDVERVGGKNASLGEMIQTLRQEEIPVPPGFAISAQVYRDFIRSNHLESQIRDQLARLADRRQSLPETGAAIRALIRGGDFTPEQVRAIANAYEELCKRVGMPDCDVAVRSSATAEDLPEASFAGQQESFLNVRGVDALLETSRLCLASLYTDRAIAYREHRGFAHEQVALSVGVQQMVRSDLGCAGVMFTLDTESGFPDVVLINGSWGLGESVVKGSVNPDRFMVYKPLLKGPFRPILERTCGSKAEKMVYPRGGTSAPQKSTLTVATTDAEARALVLNDDEILNLAKWGQAIENHYRRAMDIEWAKDGKTGQMYIVQARPETIESQKERAIFYNYKLKEKGQVILEGASVGSAVASAPACRLDTPDQADRFPDGAILVTDRTDPDWGDVMRKASGIITNSGGTTSHAAIVSRELKIPAIVGTGTATQVVKDGQKLTLDCSEGAVGKVYQGMMRFEKREVRVDQMADTRTQLMINVAMPDGAMYWWQLPTRGIGLARIEFIISGQSGIHPMALLHPKRVQNRKVLNRIREMTQHYDTMAEYFVDKLSTGIAKIAASCYPNPAVVRFSDLKSNEYRGLVGGKYFEIEEANPMLGLRGASRYYHPNYQEAFELECKALKRAREEMGFDNIVAMIPFCRTPEEADKVMEIMANAGLKRGENGLQVYVMCEIPSNVILAEQFAERFDGFSIGSNDLTQLILGIDRDSTELRYLFDARDEAVKRMVAQVIKVAHEKRCKVGICGQAPSDYPDFAAFLVDCGIDSISLNPDSIIRGSQHIAAAEKGR